MMKTGALSSCVSHGLGIMLAALATLVPAPAGWAAPAARAEQAEKAEQAVPAAPDGVRPALTLDDFSSPKARSGRPQLAPGSRDAMREEAFRRAREQREAERAALAEQAERSRVHRHGEHARLTRVEQETLWGRDRRQHTVGMSGGCRAPASIAPCAALGVASQEKKNGPDVAEGNPVNPLTGHKYQVELDAAPADGVLGLEIRRHYSSALGAVANPVGRGWMLSYDTRLYAVGNSLQIIQADGNRLIFQRPPPAADKASGSTSGDGMSVPAAGYLRQPWRPDWLRSSSRPMCVAPDGEKRLLRSILAPRQETTPVCTGQADEDGEVLLLASGYRWRWPSGRELDFDAAGFLVMIREPKAGAAVSGASSSAGAGVCWAQAVSCSVSRFRPRRSSSRSPISGRPPR